MNNTLSFKNLPVNNFFNDQNGEPIATSPQNFQDFLADSPISSFPKQRPPKVVKFKSNPLLSTSNQVSTDRKLPRLRRKRFIDLEFYEL